MKVSSVQKRKERDVGFREKRKLGGGEGNGNANERKIRGWEEREMSLVEERGIERKMRDETGERKYK